MVRHLVTGMLLLAPSIAAADKEFVDGTGATYDCGEDPVVNVAHDAATYTFTGACTEINLDGSKLVVTIADVGTVNVNGTGNAVTATEIGTIHINGTKNKVRWKKAKTGKKPKVATNGRGNGVVKIK